MNYSHIAELLGSEAKALLDHKCQTIPARDLEAPSAGYVDRVFVNTDRNIQTLRSLQLMFDTGRLKGTGYLSILPVDQGIEN